MAFGLWSTGMIVKSAPLILLSTLFSLQPVCNQGAAKLRIFEPPGLPEFNATMDDKRFLAALLQDHVRERLRVGAPMTLRLAVKEVKIGGVWQQKRAAVDP